MSRRRVPAFLLAAVLALLCVPAAAQAAPPVNTAIPGLTGEPRVGQQLTATNGTWTPVAGLQLSQTYERCDTDGASCEPIVGLTGLKYTLTTADLGARVRVAITATNTEGAATAYSPPIPVVGPRQVPELDPSVPPTVSGLAQEGQTLTATDGSWFGPPTISLSRKWQRCDSGLTSCTTLTATGTTYKLVPADIGSVMRVLVTALNPDGSATATSSVSAVVVGVAPVNTVAPTIAGELRDGQTLTVKAIGTWTGTAPMTPTYQWERCTGATGDTCTPIGGQTTASYPLATADVGSFFRVVVTQTNVAGSTSATSAISAVVTAKQPPVVGTAPVVTGTPIDQQTLSSTTGTWSGTPAITTTRQWQRCTSLGLSCADVPGTLATYKLGPSDVGSTMRVKITAKNADGQTDDYTAVSPVVQAAIPVLSTAPAVTGTARDGQVLTATSGSWKGTATINYDFQWQSCTSGGCTNIVGADGPTYRLTSSEIGTSMKVVVTAWNGGGSTVGASATTAVVTEGPPVNMAKPTVSAPQARDGQTFTATTGTWVGTGTPDFEFQWQRCSNTGASCVAIPVANAQTYNATSLDVGKTVRAVVTALTPYGTTVATSDPSPVIVAVRPEIVGSVAISGTQRDGQTVTATHTWSGTTPMQYGYQWSRCAVTCVDIAGATKGTYALVQADVGARMRVRVIATNVAGSQQADSGDDPLNPAVLAIAPTRTGDPAITGTAKEGATLTSTNGTFSGSAPFTYAYEWLRCNADGLSCLPIGGATSATYALTAADRGVTVRTRVTATNSGGSDSATSLPSAIVGLSAPSNTIAPAVTPAQGLKDGALVTTTNGTWAGSGPIEYTYQWQRCNASGAACANIVGAAAQSYRITSSEVGGTVRVLVTATNGAGTASQAAPATGIVGTNPPSNDVAPVLSIGGDGVAVDGAVVYTTVGTWSGVVPMTTTYQWRRCDTAGENCGTIPGATASSYTLTPQDVGLTIRAYVIQANSGGTMGALTAPTATVVAAPPSNLAPPAISGGAAIGRTLTAQPGLWIGTPELRYDFQWLQCDLAGANCAPIAGAQASTYLVRPQDAALSLRVQVKASNDVGWATAESLSTGEVQTQPPTEIDGPTIDDPDLLAQGAVLQGRPGVWGGAQPVDFAYQWRRCSPALTGCIDIDDATGAAYELTKDDVGKRVLFVLTAENVVGVATVQTAATDVVLPEPPSNTTAPTIVTTGTLRDGVKLTANNGVWKGATPMTYTVSWWRCNAAGAECLPATDVTGGTYTLTSDDVGRRMRARVTAKNAATEVSVDTAATAVVAAALPSASLRPTVVVLDGKAAVGGRLRGAAGTWSGTQPMTLALQWQRCVGATTAACDDVPGATTNEYVLNVDDVGKRMRLVVRATNAGGTVVSESSPSEVVPAIPPDTAGTPTIVGSPIREGVTLTAIAGHWTGSLPITLGYQWERCTDPGAASCPKIAGGSRETFTPTSADVGKYLRVTVTGVNAGGKAARSSVPTAAVDGIAPSSITPPTARTMGTVKVGGSLQSTTGKWGGTAPLKYETRWQRCDVTGVTCEDLEGASKPVYKLTAEDVNGTLLAYPMRVVVTATNSAGSVEAASALLGKPVNVGDPGSADNVPGSAKRKKAKDSSGRGRPGQTKPNSTGKTLTKVKRLRFTPKGRLLLTLICPKKAKTTCGAFGSFGSGALRYYVDAGPLKKGTSKNVGFPISKADRLRLRGRRVVDFAFRLRAPQAKSKKMKTSRKRVAVTSKLSGKRAKKTSKKSSKKKSSSKTKKPTKTKTASKTTPTSTSGAAAAPTG